MPPAPMTVKLPASPARARVLPAADKMKDDTAIRLASPSWIVPTGGRLDVEGADRGQVVELAAVSSTF